ncbi:MAG: HNH endonuclease [Sphaerochaeta sp.]|nr:HNH endonuclease [Sphaerochaeta sp.]
MQERRFVICSHEIDEVKAFINSHYKGITTKELTNLVNAKFDTSFSIQQLLNYKKNHKLNSGLTGYFQKGHEPSNKGKRMEEFLSPETIKKFKQNQFDKGHRPHNHLPVGTEILRPDGYVWRKIGEPNKWLQKHHILYKQYHGTGIPEGQCVTFLDGDRHNFEKDNLALVSLPENQYLNKMGLRFEDQELTKTGIAIARLQVTITKKTRKEN